MTPNRIEPATQRFNHCATAVPLRPVKNTQNRPTYPTCLGISELFEGCGELYEASNTLNVTTKIERSCVDVSTATGASAFQTASHLCQIHHKADGGHF